MIKVVYFDEQSATDYLDLRYGGRFESVEEQVQAKKKRLFARIEAQAGAGLKMFHVLKASLKGEAKGEVSKYGTNVLKNTFTNTVLSDFVKEARNQDNEDIIVFEQYVMQAKENSFAFMKMYTPYTVLINQDLDGIDIGKLDEVLESAKGYYELLGRKDRQTIVLRFNISSFRNNYGLIDLLKMDLIFYAIKVGKCLEDDLLMENEMSHQTKEISAIDIYEENKTSDSYLNVYDVILTGIGSEQDE